jgi:uncharacterized cofD-like protein
VARSTGGERPRVVAVGGGHGLAKALGALRLLDLTPTAVVTVADDGGSSGRLRRDLGIIAPGDLRMALLTLARNRALADVLAHRFVRGELEGHALGNLALVALAERAEGDFVAALDAAAALLDCAGRVLPSTRTPVQLKARVLGEEVDGQVRVAHATGPIECVWLEPGAPAACPEAVAAITDADLVLLGPGSLFTSVVATLLVPGIGDAVISTPAPVVAILNLSTQPGETTGFDASAHVDALLAHLPDLALDAVLLHDGPDDAGEGEAIPPTLEHPAVGRLLRADLLARDPDGGPGWGHDPARLAAALGPLIDALPTGADGAAAAGA